MERPVAVVVDGDTARRERIRELLTARDLTPVVVDGAQELERVLAGTSSPIVFVDVAVPWVDLRSLAGRQGGAAEPRPAVVALSGPFEPERRRRLREAGACDVLHAGFDDDQLDWAVLHARAEQDLRREIGALRGELRRREGYDGLVGRSGFMHELRERIDQLAGRAEPVWLYGEAGVGKDYTARAIHGQANGGGPFRTLRCTSAWEEEWRRLDAPGSGGSLYLDGVPELPLEAQEGLLGRLARTRSADPLRLVASSVDEPRSLAASGRLLPALVEQLAVHVVRLAPLRERSEDVALLTSHFISRIREINPAAAVRLEPQSLEVLVSYSWPQNLRELRNVLEQALILASDGRIRPRDLPERLRRTRSAAGAAFPSITAERSFREAKGEVVQVFERAYLADLMDRFNGNVTAASQGAGMLRSALQRLLRKCGLKSSEFRRRTPRAAPAPTRTPSA